MWSVLELIGLALIVAFAWFIWPPLILLVAGCVLVIVAADGERRAAAREDDPAEVDQ